MKIEMIRALLIVASVPVAIIAAIYALVTCAPWLLLAALAVLAVVRFAP
jgi:hypothetical protein